MSKEANNRTPEKNPESLLCQLEKWIFFSQQMNLAEQFPSQLDLADLGDFCSVMNQTLARWMADKGINFYKALSKEVLNPIWQVS